MKGKPVDLLVYAFMFPKPKPGDPQSFHDFLRRQLVPEVRSETACFYGGLDSLEAQYPGLDYSYPPHRMRLGRYTWHRRLFRAFDTLRLTSAEIAGLTKWEGTRWARERYEKEHSMIIRDTTGDCILDWVDPQFRQPTRSNHIPQTVQEEKMELAGGDRDMDDIDDDGDESDMEIESVGLELNERLRAAVALREAGNSTTVMDEAWEQWLKEVTEAGSIPPMADYVSSTPESSNPGELSSTSVPPRLLNAARLGQWHQIPEFLQDMVRQNVEAHDLHDLSNVHTPTTEQASQRRENPVPVPGRAALRSISTSSPISNQQRHAADPNSSMRRSSYYPQAPAGSLRSVPQSWRREFQQEDSG